YCKIPLLLKKIGPVFPSGPLEPAISADPRASTPPLIFTPPVKVFAPDNVNVPVPVFVTVPVAFGLRLARSLMTPVNVVDTLLAPTVKVVGMPLVDSPRITELVPAPVFASEPICGLNDVNLTVAVPLAGFINNPLLLLIAKTLPSAPSLAATTIPFVTVVGP